MKEINAHLVVIAEDNPDAADRVERRRMGKPIAVNWSSVLFILR